MFTQITAKKIKWHKHTTGGALTNIAACGHSMSSKTGISWCTGLYNV